MAYQVHCNMARYYSGGAYPQHREWEEKEVYSNLLIKPISYKQCSNCGLIQVNLSEAEKNVFADEFDFRTYMKETRMPNVDVMGNPLY